MKTQLRSRLHIDNNQWLYKIIKTVVSRLSKDLIIMSRIRSKWRKQETMRKWKRKSPTWSSTASLSTWIMGQRRSKSWNRAKLWSRVWPCRLRSAVKAHLNESRSRNRWRKIRRIYNPWLMVTMIQTTTYRATTGAGVAPTLLATWRRSQITPFPIMIIDSLWTTLASKWRKTTTRSGITSRN